MKINIIEEPVAPKRFQDMEVWQMFTDAGTLCIKINTTQAVRLRDREIHPIGMHSVVMEVIEINVTVES